MLDVNTYLQIMLTPGIRPPYARCHYHASGHTMGACRVYRYYSRCHEHIAAESVGGCLVCIVPDTATTTTMGNS